MWATLNLLAGDDQFKHANLKLHLEKLKYKDTFRK
jgi:hypothetical protein